MYNIEQQKLISLSLSLYIHISDSIAILLPTFEFNGNLLATVNKPLDLAPIVTKTTT